MGLVLLFHWLPTAILFPSIIDHFSQPMTLQEAREQNCPIPLPEEAKNIRFGISAASQRYEYLVRFEAPADVCRYYAYIVRSAEGIPMPALNGMDGPIPRLSPLKQNSARRPDGDFVHAGEAAWFDIGKIANGETACIPSAQIWIDDDRGIFYYHRVK